jgi:6-phosphogluconolactonase
VAFAPNAGLLAIGGQGGQISEYAVDGSTGALSAAPGSPFATTATSPATSVAFNAGATELAAVWNGGLWLFSVDPSTGALTPVAGSPFGNQRGWSAADFTPGGRLLGASADGSSVLAIEPANSPSAITGSPFLPIDDLAWTPTSKAFSPSGELLAAAIGYAEPGTSGPGPSGAGLASIDPAAVEPGGTTFSGGGARTITDSVAFSPDGQLLVTGNFGGSVSLFTVGGARIACHVPDVRGRSLRTAVRRLRAAQCARGRVRTARGARQPLVVGAQTPAAGKLEPHGERVGLRLIRRL